MNGNIGDLDVFLQNEAETFPPVSRQNIADTILEVTFIYQTDQRSILYVDRKVLEFTGKDSRDEKLPANGMDYAARVEGSPNAWQRIASARKLHTVRLMDRNERIMITDWNPRRGPEKDKETMPLIFLWDTI